jgi:Lrp/AsnC family transcriptional regulator, leucine-responsive regulatory protein
MQLTALARRVDKISQVICAYRMTGDTCFLAMVVAESTEHLEKLLDEISAYAQMSTSIVVSTPVVRHSLLPSAF